MRDPVRISALFLKGVDEVDSGFGIDGLRLTATVTEPLAPEQDVLHGMKSSGHLQG